MENPEREDKSRELRKRNLTPFHLQPHLQVRIFTIFSLIRLASLCLIKKNYYFWVVLFSESEEENGGNLDHVGQVVGDLIMWKDASKSSSQEREQGQGMLLILI